MSIDERATRHATAASEFNEHLHRGDGMRFVGELIDGLRGLSDAFFTRIHADTEQQLGTDSMLMPISIIKSEIAARNEIELYQVVESALHARAHHYAGDDDWYLHWLLDIRYGDAPDRATIDQRVANYTSRAADPRRRTFVTALERAFPEASRAPLVLYKLLPLAVAITTSVAFGDSGTAQAARDEQKQLLPVIADCARCRGRLLENGEKCAHCGNPLWTYAWLTAY